MFGPPQEGAKGRKVKYEQRQWCGGTLIVTTAVQRILCGEFVIWCVSGFPVTTSFETTVNGLYSFIQNNDQIGLSLKIKLQ